MLIKVSNITKIRPVGAALTLADRQTDGRMVRHDVAVLLSKTNRMQRYTVFFIIVKVLYVSGGFSAHHQELKNCTHSNWYVPETARNM
jgi:hypothetical protein